ncbi:MAG: YihY/virulence factor BrkB family protein [Pseudomonadota bacterium]|nr:YihY/virulence factor BrkB family protein [Pseudomonadota bacterium]
MTSAAKSSNEPAKRSLEILRNPKALWELVRDSVSAWVDDFAPSMGAAISYYSVFSIAPLLLIVIAIAGLVLGRDAASGKIFEQLQGLMGNEGAAAIQGMVKSASSPGKSVLATVIGVVTLLLGATTVFTELQTSLDRIWRAPAAKKKEGIWNLLRSRVLSFGMILGIGFLLLITLVVSAGLATIGSMWAPLFGGWEILAHILDFLVSFAVVTALFAMIYKWLPRAKIAWHDVWIGAAATALLFTIGKLLIGLYIGKSSVTSGFGAAGSLVVLLVWVYYSSQIFLLGAEFAWVYSFRYGSRRGEKPPEPAVPASSDVPKQKRADPPEAAPPRRGARVSTSSGRGSAVAAGKMAKTKQGRNAERPRSVKWAIVGLVLAWARGRSGNKRTEGLRRNDVSG